MGDWEVLEGVSLEDLFDDELEGMDEAQIQELIQAEERQIEEERLHDLKTAPPPTTPAAVDSKLPHASATSTGDDTSGVPPSGLTAEHLASHAAALEKQRHIRQLQADMAALRDQNQQLQQALLDGKNLSELDSRTKSSAGGSAAARAAAKARRVAQKAALAAGTASASELERQLQLQREVLAVRQRGVDICILIDCTGSMVSHIEAAKAKAMEIFDLAPRVHADAITRMAFIGYRDFGSEAGDGHFTICDFVDKDGVNKLLNIVRKLRASGGGNAEDVTGALKMATQLSWQSSTRLLIHMGDAPCHGRRYHDGYPVNGADSHPNGNPDGLTPEDQLRWLAANRVDYHFARICGHTDIMTKLFQEEYAKASGAASFEMHEYGASADTFIPVVLKSVTSSMHRSFRSSSSSSSSIDGYKHVELPDVLQKRI